MSAEPAVNRRIVLARRPQGEPTGEDFRLERAAVPVPGAGEVLLRTRWLSLDPYMRGRMSSARSYATPVEVGAVMVGQTVCVVAASNAAGFKAGDLVLANAGWQDYALSDGRDLTRIEPGLGRPSYALGVLGMPGLTAYVGLLDIGLQVGRQRLPDYRISDPATYRCELLDILGIQRSELGVDHLGQTAFGDEVAVRVRSSGEAVGYAYSCGGEVSDHLAQRCVLPAHLVEIGEAEIGEPRDGRGGRGFRHGGPFCRLRASG